MLNTIKAALIEAHKTNNKRAISAQDCEKLGITTQSLEQWKAYVSELRDAVIAFNRARNDENITDAQVTKLQGAVYAQWRKVLKQGAENDFCRSFYIRKHDIVDLAGLCGEKMISTAVGKRMADHTLTDFRRNIEALVGIRMVVGGYIDEETATVILEYEGALRTIKSKTDAIEGVTRGQTHIPGLRVMVAAAKAKLAGDVEKMQALNIEQAAIDEFTKELREQVNDYQAQLDDAKAKLKEATENAEKLEPKYNEVMASIHTIDEKY